jgi:hypothetical protein
LLKFQIITCSLSINTLLKSKPRNKTKRGKTYKLEQFYQINQSATLQIEINCVIILYNKGKYSIRGKNNMKRLTILSLAFFSWILINASDIPQKMIPNKENSITLINKTNEAILYAPAYASSTHANRPLDAGQKTAIKLTNKQYEKNAPFSRIWIAKSGDDFYALNINDYIKSALHLKKNPNVQILVANRDNTPWINFFITMDGAPVRSAWSYVTTKPKNDPREYSEKVKTETETLMHKLYPKL